MIVQTARILCVVIRATLTFERGCEGPAMRRFGRPCGRRCLPALSGEMWSESTVAFFYKCRRSPPSTEIDWHRLVLRVIRLNHIPLNRLNTRWLFLAFFFGYGGLLARQRVKVSLGWTDESRQLFVWKAQVRLLRRQQLFCSLVESQREDWPYSYGNPHRPVWA